MPDTPGPLRDVRVIDLATPRGELAGRLLADLGAEVIKVEPPGGADSRRRPPFEGGRGDGPGDSLYWAAVGLGKRSLVLDLHDAAQRERLRAMLRRADVLIESFDPGAMAALGLDYATVAALNPALIYASITPYGQDGPDAASPATDLTLEAAGGLISMQGDRDRPPVPVGYPQASFHAGAQAAADIAIALHERLRSGRGQQLDVSMQAAIVWTLMNATGYPPNTGDDPPVGGRHRADPPPEIVPGLGLAGLWPCADGYATYQIALPAIGGRTHERTMRWLEEEGALPQALEGIDWTNWIAEVVGGTLAVATMAASLEALGAFLKTKTKAEIQARGLDQRILLGAQYDIADLRADPQLAARDYWTEVGGRTHPGPFARLSRTPIRLRSPAPALDEGAALGDAPSSPALAALPRAAAARHPAFDGLKVADFAWVGVGPIISKALADHGATVVHVESATHPDVLRLVPPFKDGEPGMDRAQFMANFNSSKLGLALDLGSDWGRRIATRLAAWADVVVESFTPGTMAKFGLDYARLSRDRPELVMLSTCLRGQTGPEAAYTGFGGQGTALAGINSLTGWPDRPPAGAWGAYTDFINPRFGVAALTAALIHRARTGEGQHVDLSQTEAPIRFIEPLVLDYTVNGRLAGAAGHDSLYACPHGVYPVAGKERYVAIAVETAEQWRALRRVALLDAFADPALDDLAERFPRRAAIDQALRAWCAEEEPFALARRLKSAGVPAAVVLWPSDLYADAQLEQRRFFVSLDHAVMGPTPYDGLVTTFSATPGRLRAAPCLGQDSERVLRELLGLSDGEMAEAAAAGALT